jgi:hypothetical protein
MLIDDAVDAMARDRREVSRRKENTSKQPVGCSLLSSSAANPN